MNYYELIYLKRELKNKLTNCVIELATTQFKNVLELYIKGDSKSSRLVFNTSPGNISLFLDGDRSPKKSNRITFFEAIYSIPIEDIFLEENDRIISISFSNGQQLTFKLFSSRANAYLVEGEIIEESFKDFGEVGKQAPLPKKSVPFQLMGEGKSVKQLLLESNNLLPRAQIDSLIKLNKMENATTDEILEFSRKVDLLLRNEAEFRLLKKGVATLFPESILPVETEKMFDSVNDLILWRSKNYSGQLRFDQRKNILHKSIRKQLKRIDSVLNNLAKAGAGLERAQDFEQKGHILMANAHLGMPDSDKLSLVDFYNDNAQLEIEVNEELSIAENASRYYEKSSNSKKSYHEAMERIPLLEKKREKQQELLNELEGIEDLVELNNWTKNHKEELATLQNSSNNEKSNSLPFHVLEVDGFEIWIGKSAKSNDKLVQLSHKEDVWLHARGVSGSHALIRMKNKKEMPQKELIKKVAGFAAYNSKAKGAELVPVIYTKRKFIRKPKGAAAGAVLVQKEQVEFVEPEKP